VRTGSEIDLNISTDSVEVKAEEKVPMRSWFYNWTYHPVTLRTPGGESTKLRWVIWPLDGETLKRTSPVEQDASGEITNPGEEYEMLAGTGKVITDWLSPIRFPAPGTYEVALVYEGAEGEGVELRSQGLVFRVGE